MFVCRQPGQAYPTVTLRLYAHEFARRGHGEAAWQVLDASLEVLRRSSAGRR